MSSLVDLTNIPSLVVESLGLRWPQHRVTSDAVIGGTIESGSRFWRTLTWKIVTAVKPEMLDPWVAEAVGHMNEDVLFRLDVDSAKRIPVPDSEAWPADARAAWRRLRDYAEPYRPECIETG